MSVEVKAVRAIQTRYRNLSYSDFREAHKNLPPSPPEKWAELRNRTILIEVRPMAKTEMSAAMLMCGQPWYRVLKGLPKGVGGAVCPHLALIGD